MFSEQNKLEFFRDGFLTLGENFAPLQRIVDDIFEKYEKKNPESSKIFHNKYNNAVDLIDETCRTEIKSIFEKHNLEKHISQVVGIPLQISHTQLRFVKTKKPSYMPLHRDVQIYNGKLTGPLPAPYKLIFYPQATDPSDSLKVVPRSHRLSLNNKLFDLTFNLIFNGLRKINFGETKAVLFDTTILHHVPTIKNENARARLIFTFTPRDI